MAETPAGQLPGGSPTGPVVPPAPQATVDKEKEIAELNAKIKEKDTALQALEGKFKGIEQTVLSPEFIEFQAGKKRGGTQQQPPQQPDVPDYDGMTNTELVQAVVKNVVGEVQKLVAPMQKTTVETDIKLQLQEAAKEHPDFWDYKDAMAKLADRMPDATPKTLYFIVKGIEASTGKALKAAPQNGGEGNPQQTSQRSESSRPVSGELGSGPPRGQGKPPEKPVSSYAEAAGEAFDEIFGKG